MCEQCEAAARSTEPRWRGRYDRKALKRACEELQIKHPVRLRCVEVPGIAPDAPLATDGLDFGGQEFDPERREHVVEVTRNLPLDVAEETLAHELAHCIQAERDGARGRLIALLDEARYGYVDSPHEVEARAVQQQIKGRFRVMRSGELHGGNEID